MSEMINELKALAAEWRESANAQYTALSKASVADEDYALADSLDKCATDVEAIIAKAEEAK